MKFLTAGESHGQYLNCIISDYPSGIDIDISFIDRELEKRQKGYGRGERMNIEKDKITIIAGLRKNKSTGAPLSFLIKNIDHKNWKTRLSREKDILNPRPGHADLPGFIKYRADSIRDVIERSSARETAARVAAGAFAKLFLQEIDVFIFSLVEQVGKECIDYDNFNLKIERNFNPFKNKEDKKLISIIEESPLRCPDKDATERMIKYIKSISEQNDSAGGVIRVFATGLVPGIGSYIQWNSRLDSKIAAAMMSIPSAKAVSIGSGLSASTIKGSEFHDEIFFNTKSGFYRNTNNAGGLEGGMTNGEPVDIKVILKPIPTTSKGLKTVNIRSKEPQTSLKERSDICAVPSAAVVAEAMMAIEIANAIQSKFGIDNINEIIKNYNDYRDYIDNI